MSGGHSSARTAKRQEQGEFGSLTHYDYGFRIYNPGIGRFLSVDLLTAAYPWYTPYQFAGNKPIKFIDLDGLEEAPHPSDDPEMDERFARERVGFGPNATLHVSPSNINFSDGAERTQFFADKKQANWNLMSRLYMEAIGILGGTSHGNTIAAASTGPTTVIVRAKRIGFFGRLMRKVRGFFKIKNKKPVTKIIEQAEVQPEFIKPGVRSIEQAFNKRFQSREPIVDENLSPSLVEKLRNAGFKVKTFAEGVLYPEIIEYAKENGAIVLTNNIRDFKKKGLTTIKAKARFGQHANHQELIDRLIKVDQLSGTDPSLLKQGNNILIGIDKFKQ